MDWWQDVFGRQFDIGRDCPLIAIGMAAAWFAMLFTIGFVTGGVKSPALDFFLPQVILVPVVFVLTAWCYRHPEQLENRPESWMYDMRLLWPFFALIYLGYCTWFFRGFYRRQRWMYWSKKGVELIETAKRLAAEGRLEEADAAYAKGYWILDHKAKASDMR